MLFFSLILLSVAYHILCMYDESNKIDVFFNLKKVN